MAATASYDARPFRDALYGDHPEMATLDLLDAEDLAIARLARERFDVQVTALATSWSCSTLDRWWRTNPFETRIGWYELAVLELHPNPARRT